MGHMKGHVRHMAVGGAAVLVVLLVAGVGLDQALRYALLLACPLGMVAMMLMMGRGTGRRSDGPHDEDQASRPGSATAKVAPRSSPSL